MRFGSVIDLYWGVCVCGCVLLVWLNVCYWWFSRLIVLLFRFLLFWFCVWDLLAVLWVACIWSLFVIRLWALLLV